MVKEKTRCENSSIVSLSCCFKNVSCLRATTGASFVLNPLFKYFLMVLTGIFQCTTPRQSSNRHNLLLSDHSLLPAVLSNWLMKASQLGDSVPLKVVIFGMFGLLLLDLSLCLSIPRLVLALTGRSRNSAISISNRFLVCPFDSHDRSSAGSELSVSRCRVTII